MQHSLFVKSKTLHKFLGLSNPMPAQKSQKGDPVIKKCVLVDGKNISIIVNTESKKQSEQVYTEEKTMALSNLAEWNNKQETAPATACGASDKPAACGASDKPAACGSACGASDKPAEKPTACGSACGAGDKQ